VRTGDYTDHRCMNWRAWLTSHDIHRPHEVEDMDSRISYRYSKSRCCFAFGKKVLPELVTMSRLLCVSRQTFLFAGRTPNPRIISNIANRRHASSTTLQGKSPAGAVTVIDSNIFGNVFATKETKAIWSDRQRTAYFLDFEAALAKVQARLGIIPQNASDEIAKNCDVDSYDFEKLREETELVGYPVLPVVHQLVAKVNAIEAGLGEWAHWGTTTQDLTDTAVVLQLRDTLRFVDNSLDGIIAALQKLCIQYKSTPMPARSNLQQAVPISFGFKMARLLASFQRHRQRCLRSFRGS
jgi:hypothetical protein